MLVINRSIFDIFENSSPGMLNSPLNLAETSFNEIAYIPDTLSEIMMMMMMMRRRRMRLTMAMMKMIVVVAYIRTTW